MATVKPSSSLTFAEYQAKAEITSKYKGSVIPSHKGYETPGDQQQIRDRLSAASMGLCGEAGEATDLLKKFLYHDHPLDQAKLRKELGDVLWYIAELCTALDWSLEQIALENGIKLKARYQDQFTSQKSIHRVEEDAAQKETVHSC